MAKAEKTDWNEGSTVTQERPSQFDQSHDPTKANPDAFKSDKPNTVEHQYLAPNKPFEGSGKDPSVRGAPIVSMSPTSKPIPTASSKMAEQEIKIYDNLSDDLFLNQTQPKKDSERYPFTELEVGQGFFLSSEGTTTDRLVHDLHRAIYYASRQFSEVERNEDGDEIWEQVTVKTRKKNDDGTFQLEGGKPIEGASFTHVPKLAYARQFIVKPVTKDSEVTKSGEKASDDGVVVIRVA